MAATYILKGRIAARMRMPYTSFIKNFNILFYQIE